VPGRPITLESQQAEARRRWDKLAEEHPELSPAIAFQRRAWLALSSASPAASLPDSPGSEARSRFLAGVPLLVAAGPHFTDEPPFGLLARVTRCVREAFQPEGADRIERAARKRAPAAGAALKAALRRDADGLTAAATELRVAADLLARLCDLAVTPSLRFLAQVAEPSIRGTAWAQGYCPVCGAWPIFGELREADRYRYLRCGLCGSDWPFERMACPFCGESDHRRLRALHVEGEAEYRRAELCENCKSYVKSLARLSATPAMLLPVEDLATAYLDLLALDAGYRRPEGTPHFEKVAASDEL
jgi:FdhE protein